MTLQEDDAGGSGTGWIFEWLASTGAANEARAATLPARIARLIRMGGSPFS
jgi:hypothetical protein